ncbi:hypothetical protein LUZ60_013796 [Juncus effusus]|nr:hypothetical protein LUZ60_013796 [Juncus effusus]
MGCEGSFRAASVGLLVGMAAAAIFIIMFNAAVDSEQSLGKFLFNSTTYLNLKHDEDLQHLLERLANGDKTVILTMVNWAWVAPNSLLDLFIESFHNGEEINHLLKHLLIIALDTRAFDRCKLLHLHCYLLKVESSNSNITSAQQFLSKGYVKLLWNRVKLQGRILELGYNFILTDVDVL